MSGIKGHQVRIDQKVWFDGVQWNRKTTVARFALRPTKGYIKDGPAKFMIEKTRTAVKPPTWKTQSLHEFVPAGRQLSDKLKAHV